MNTTSLTTPVAKSASDDLARLARVAAFEQRNRNLVYEAVVRALEQSGLAKKDIASNIAKDPAQITRWLKGPSNWTLDTVSNLLLAVDAEITPHVTFFKDKMAQKSNHFHPVSLAPRAVAVRSVVVTQHSSGAAVAFQTWPTTTMVVKASTP